MSTSTAVEKLKDKIVENIHVLKIMVKEQGEENDILKSVVKEQGEEIVRLLAIIKTRDEDHPSNFCVHHIRHPYCLKCKIKSPNN